MGAWAMSGEWEKGSEGRPGLPRARYINLVLIVTLALGGAFLTKRGVPGTAAIPSEESPRPDEPDELVIVNAGAVSPDGRYVLVHVFSFLPRENFLETVPNAVVDWKTGHVGAWRGMPISNVSAWSPRGDLVVRSEGLMDRGSLARTLVCRRLPDLSEVWRVDGGRAHSAWTPDGRQLIAAVSGGREDVWNLEAVSRSGTRRVLVRDCRWVPLRVIRHGKQLAIVCSTRGEKPAPLTLLSMSGDVIAQVGPPLPRGAYAIEEPLDRFGWVSADRDRCLLVVKKGDRWQQILLKDPSMQPGFTDMIRLTSEQGWLIGSSDDDRRWSSWAVERSGKLRKLRNPPAYDHERPEPWIDGRHLLYAKDNRLVLVDGHSGKIVREVAVKLPEAP